jgi:hypothetical protein
LIDPVPVTVTAPVALKTTTPPLEPSHALAVNVLSMVTVVHWGTRWTTIFWLPASVTS